ncbi:MAG: DUF4424 family protein [Bacteroidia bacterium]|nr:DUF4424 family protein [Bacteroidia bacterium]
MKPTIIIIFSFVCNCLFSQDLQFYREDLNFEIKNNYFYVDGIYYFCNVGEREVSRILYYPFPTDSNLGDVDSIKVTDLSKNSSENINRNAKGIYFKINLNSYGIAKYNITYRQKLFKNKTEYILTTTQSWKRPFETVNYKLTVSESTTIDSLSYLPDSAVVIGNKRCYYWHKEKFMPDKNMIILVK